MATSLVLFSRENFLADLVRTVDINTDITAFNEGSDIVTILEAISEALFQVEVSALKILESVNINALVGTALDKKAQSSRIPNGQGGYGRKPALQASGPIIIGSSFSKISSKLYAGKPSPFAGSTQLTVEDASSFPSTGSVYIGRNTLDRFEGPIPYSSVTNNGSFWTITLSQSLTKDHLQSDIVTLSQGGDRVVAAGTTVQIESKSDSPAVNFVTTQDLLIPDGEDEGTVNVVCNSFGTKGNALAGAITRFTSLPFPGATVRNTTTFRNGQSSESDEDLKQRIKNYPSTLSRGTDRAILSAIQGATDPNTGRSIQSATVLPPVEPGDFARVFIDDKTGLEPSIDNQPSELLLSSSSGQETQLKTAQFPITSAIVEGSEFGPFVLTSGMTIQIRVDEIIEIYTITTSNYKNLNSATAYEIVRDLNSQSNIVGFRTIDEGTRVVGIDLSGSAEVIQVTSGDLQKVLGFSTAELRPIFLYKNTSLLSFKGKTASLETRARNLWNVTSSDLQNVRVRVDSVIQTFSVTDSDFTEFSTNIANATISQWATIFSRKIAGVKFTTSGQILIWSTYNTFSESGQLEILDTLSDGSPAPWIGDDKIWLPETSGGVLSDVGSFKDYKFNRFTGEITLLQKPDVNDSIEIATRNTRALIRSSITDNGLYTLSPIPSTIGNSKLIVGFDGQFAIRNVTVASGASMVPTQPSPSDASNIIRMTVNDPGVFSNSEIGDYFYILPDQSALSTLLPTNAEGFYRILARGFNTTELNIIYSGLLGATFTFAGLTVNTVVDSNIVQVNFIDHGLQTGDLITITTASPIGGISAGNLSVTDAPITKISDDVFTFQALASATTQSSGTLDLLGHNKILVTHTLHGLNAGAGIDSLVTVGFGGIASGDLTVSNAPIEFVDSNSYYYRAAAAATSSSSGQVINNITQLADTWVEFEVSSAQFVTWSGMLSTVYGLTEYMIHVFKSANTTPQLIDFGNSVSNVTVDNIVTSINNQIASGSAVKVTPQQVEIRSNKFNNDGTCAVLAVIGNSENLFSTSVSSAIQAHTAFSESGNVLGGAPVVSGIAIPTAPSSGYPTRSYLQVDKNITDVLDELSNPTIESPTAYNPVYPVGFQHLWLTGRAEGYSARVYNNQTTAPYTGILTGSEIIKPLNTFDSEQTNPDTLNRYANFGLRLQDLSINNHDSLVVEMDLNPTDKTVSVPMAKLAEIQDIDAIAGTGKGQVISFRLLDPEDSDRPFFDSTSVYKDFDFTDFKILTKSVGLYREDVSDRALILRSVDYGASAQLRLSIRYPTVPDQTDILITHTVDFLNDRAMLNMIATLPSQSVITGSILSSGQYKVTVSASSTLYDWRISSPNLNNNGSYVAGNVLNIYGNSLLAGSYQITDALSGVYTNLSASVLSGSNIVTVTQASHGFQTGDLVTILTATAIGGISAANLSVTNAVVTFLTINTFTYTALANATSNDSGLLDSLNGGVVTVKSPGSGGLSPSQIFDAAVSPIRTYDIVDKTLDDLATAINDFLPNNPIATAETIGTDIATNPIALPTYVVYPNSSSYSGSDISGAFRWHSFECHYSGSAGIFQYDSSVPSANGIKATVQTDESIFPTTSEASGTSYLPVGEQVQIVPTNTKTLSKWMNFRAVSSLNLLANIERTDSDQLIQISSVEDGSDGAVNVTGVSANAVDSTIIGNASNVDNSIKMTTLSANARSLIPYQFVLIENALNSEILRSYRNIPTGSSITLANPVNVNTYFRPENSIKYIRVNSNTGRLIFLRNGMASSQSEPLDTDNTITFTDLGSGLVRVTSAQGTNPDANTGKLSARVGDMMYVQPGSPFAVDARCKAIPTTGRTVGTDPEYLGYPVVHVEDDNNILIIAPNITTFNTTVLLDGMELIFIPAIWNEKNIRTNHQAGAKFDLLNSDGKAYYLVKSIGSGLVSVFLQNSATEATDSMLLDIMSVNTDDYVIFGDGFDPANQGTYRLVAHNGRNHVVIYNPNGGRDELIDLNSLTNGGEGDRKWRVGPLDDGLDRALRIVSSDSVRIGDMLRISSPPTGSQWFNDVFFGSWQITAIGLQALDYTGLPLPHSTSDGSFDQNYIAPYIDITIPNAPISITDSAGSNVESFLISGNASAIGFTEGAPFSAIRMVVGHGVNNQNVENRDVFLRPQIGTQKFSSTFGTSITALNKIGFVENTFQGIDGYKVYSGLVQLAHRIIDGLPQNTVVFPGTKAAGAIVEVLPPLIRSIQVALQVRPKDGVTLNSIQELVKSAVASYVNDLGVGKPVVLSEISRTVQGLPGVFSVKILSTLPASDDDRIVVSDIEKAFISDVETDVTVG